MDQRTCEHCGDEFPRTHPARRFCSRTCKSLASKARQRRERAAARPPRIPAEPAERFCIECGERITGKGRKYCDDCRSRARGQWDRTSRIPCSECGGPTGWRLHEAHRASDNPTCNKCRGVAPSGAGTRAATCKECGVEFRSRKRFGDTWVEFCSKSCMGLNQWKTKMGFTEAERLAHKETRRLRRQRERGEWATRRRRARLLSVDREPYTLAQIAERDGFRCGICGRKVDMALKFPHPRSPSVDHIIPLSKGGDDTKANVRLAHWGENLMRGNRADWEQPLLLG